MASPKGYKSFGRLFEYHIARVETGVRCKDNLDCYAEQAKLKLEDTRSSWRSTSRTSRSGPRMSC